MRHLQRAMVQKSFKTLKMVERCPRTGSSGSELSFIDTSPKSPSPPPSSGHDSADSSASLLSRLRNQSLHRQRANPFCQTQVTYQTSRSSRSEIQVCGRSGRMLLRFKREGRVMELKRTVEIKGTLLSIKRKAIAVIQFEQ